MSVESGDVIMADVAILEITLLPLFALWCVCVWCVGIVDPECGDKVIVGPVDTVLVLICPCPCGLWLDIGDPPSTGVTDLGEWILPELFGEHVRWFIGEIIPIFSQNILKLIILFFQVHKKSP